MPRLIVSGHKSMFPLADVMRMFFGAAAENGGDSIIAGKDGIVIKSECLPVSEQKYLVATSSGNYFLRSEVQPEEIKRESKRQLYQMLEYLTGIKWPWGSLTGVRPTQIAARCLAEEKTEEEALQKLVDYWLVSQPRAELAIKIARRETAILNQIPDDSFCVYTGIPFCPGRCAYCSFISHESGRYHDLLTEYVKAIAIEARSGLKNKKHSISSLYIGGGTPTCLDRTQLELLFQGLSDAMDLALIPEITVEAGRPDTIDQDKLRVLRSFGVERICINPQTFHDKTLNRIGRRHNTRDIYLAYAAARAAGFRSINMDLIAGLPGETAADFLFSLQAARELAPESITIHSLALKRGSYLKQDPGELANPEPSPELESVLLQAYESLEAGRYYPYYLYRQKNSVGGLENTGFSLQGSECTYNVAMMSDLRSVIGLGAGAMSKWIFAGETVRRANPRDIRMYLARSSELGGDKKEIMDRTIR